MNFLIKLFTLFLLLSIGVQAQGRSEILISPSTTLNSNSRNPSIAFVITEPIRNTFVSTIRLRKRSNLDFDVVLCPRAPRLFGSQNSSCALGDTCNRAICNFEIEPSWSGNDYYSQILWEDCLVDEAETNIIPNRCQKSGRMESGNMAINVDATTTTTITTTSTATRTPVPPAPTPTQSPIPTSTSDSNSSTENAKTDETSMTILWSVLGVAGAVILLAAFGAWWVKRKSVETPDISEFFSSPPSTAPSPPTFKEPETKEIVSNSQTNRYEPYRNAQSSIHGNSQPIIATSQPSHVYSNFHVQHPTATTHSNVAYSSSSFPNDNNHLMYNYPYSSQLPQQQQQQHVYHPIYVDNMYSRQNST